MKENLLVSNRSSRFRLPLLRNLRFRRDFLKPFLSTPHPFRVLRQLPATIDPHPQNAIGLLHREGNPPLRYLKLDFRLFSHSQSDQLDQLDQSIKATEPKHQASAHPTCHCTQAQTRIAARCSRDRPSCRGACRPQTTSARGWGTKSW